jgi:redox-sensitive bicupin YhaK (pirin superfamily)
VQNKLTSKDDHVTAKIIAGEAFGNQAVIDTRTSKMYLHFTLQPNGEILQHIPKEYNAFVYVINGIGYFGKYERPAQRADCDICQRW